MYCTVDSRGSWCEHYTVDRAVVAVSESFKLTAGEEVRGGANEEDRALSQRAHQSTYPAKHQQDQTERKQHHYHAVQV